MNKNSIEIPLVKATYEELQQVICELQVERYKYKTTIDKIKEYCNNRLQYYNEMERDYGKIEFSYAENDNESILELLEEIE